METELENVTKNFIGTLKQEPTVSMGPNEALKKNNENIPLEL